jgi:hypothetical protein
MKKHVTLYSSMVPLWFILLVPTTWIFLIATQFIIVSFVLYAGLKYIDYPDPTVVWRKSIIWTTLYGFISYLLMCLLFLLTHIVPETSSFGAWVIENITQPLNVNPFSSIFSILYILVGLVLIGTIVYFANKKLSFRTTNLTAVEKHKISLCLAIFSAPYIALFPSYLLYQ